MDRQAWQNPAGANPDADVFPVRITGVVSWSGQVAYTAVERALGGDGVWIDKPGGRYIGAGNPGLAPTGLGFLVDTTSGVNPPAGALAQARPSQGAGGLIFELTPFAGRFGADPLAPSFWTGYNAIDGTGSQAYPFNPAANGVGIVLGLLPNQQGGGSSAPQIDARLRIPVSALPVQIDGVITAHISPQAGELAGPGIGYAVLAADLVQLNADGSVRRTVPGAFKIKVAAVQYFRIDYPGNEFFPATTFYFGDVYGGNTGPGGLPVPPTSNAHGQARTTGVIPAGGGSVPPLPGETEIVIAWRITPYLYSSVGFNITGPPAAAIQVDLGGGRTCLTYRDA